MAELNSDTVLQLAPSLNVELGGRRLIHVGGRHVPAPANVLAILEAFTHPVTFSKAVKSLSEKVAGAQAWIDLVSGITNLYKEGVLIDEAGSVPARGTAWSAPEVHISVLNDRVRTETFIRAIEAVVRPGDIVVDIGTGTGVLAVAAARAGARHVYAIEATEVGRAAQEVFAANDFADRITLLPGWSSQVELPERANVLIAEIIGNDPVEEGVMETFADARTRFLTPDARIIPHRVQVLGIPIVIDEKVTPRFFDLDVAPGEPISTSPAVAAETCSWATKIWISDVQRAVEPGNRFKVAYKYRVDSPDTRIEIIPLDAPVA